jgi:hypothetical protein
VSTQLPVERLLLFINRQVSIVVTPLIADFREGLIQ